MEPEHLPLVQSEVILLFQSLRCSEVHLVECVLGSWSCLAFCHARAYQHSLSVSSWDMAAIALQHWQAWSEHSQATIPCGVAAKSGTAARRGKIWSWQRSPCTKMLHPGHRAQLINQRDSGTDSSWWSVVSGSQLLPPWPAWINAKATSTTLASHLPRRTQQRWPLNVDTHLKKNSRDKIK